MPAARVLLEAVAEVARIAGDVALGHFGGPLDVELKVDGSPVTVADRAAEYAARAWLDRRFPDDSIEGEEMGRSREGAARRWLIDPIDGTKAFVRGVPLWGTLVAVTEGTEVLAGCAYFPATGEIAVAARGEGCWWNDSRARVSATPSLDAATVLTTDDHFDHAARRDGWHRLAGAARVARTWGDCYGYLLVATGRADVMCDPVMHDWDAAAVMPIILEAGGVFTDWDGAATAFGGSVIASNAALANPARRFLRGADHT